MLRGLLRTIQIILFERVLARQIKHLAYLLLYLLSAIKICLRVASVLPHLVQTFMRLRKLISLMLI